MNILHNEQLIFNYRKTDNICNILKVYEKEDPIILTLSEESTPFTLGMSEQFIIHVDEKDHYTGTYVVDPTFTTQTLETTDKIMDDDVIVNPIEVSRTSNPSGGKTVYIGGII